MSEQTETPENIEREYLQRLYGAPKPRYQTEHEWRMLIAKYLERMVVCLERAPWMQAVPLEPPAGKEPVTPELPVSRKAASSEIPETNEPLPTWILTDEAVSRIEEAVESEQRVRGRAYGGG